MPQTEARAWWDDVQHLRPDAPAAPTAALRLAAEPTPAPSRRVLLVTDDEPRLPASRRRPADDLPTRAPRRAVELLEPLADDGRGDHDDLAPRRAARRRPADAGRADLDFDFGPSATDRARRRTEARRTPAAGTSMELTLSSRPAAAPARAVPSPAATRTHALLPARRERADRPVRAEGGVRSAFTARMLATPEHFALYAVVLGILLVIVAASSGR